MGSGKSKQSKSKQSNGARLRYCVAGAATSCAFKERADPVALDVNRTVETAGIASAQGVETGRGQVGAGNGVLREVILELARIGIGETETKIEVPTFGTANVIDNVVSESSGCSGYAARADCISDNAATGQIEGPVIYVFTGIQIVQH